MEHGKGGLGQSVWPKPVLARDGWKQQPGKNDNRGETTEVIERLRANPRMGREVIVLGKTQAMRVENEILAQCPDCANAKIEICEGFLHNIFEKIQPLSRVLLLGVYDARSFFKADPLKGYPVAGFDEYLNNPEILGQHFWFDWLFWKDGQLITKSSGLELSVSDPDEVRKAVKKQLLKNYSSLTEYYGNCGEPAGDLIAIQVVGAKEHNSGFFLSHWFSLENLNGMLEWVFPWPEYLVGLTRFPKGALFEIRKADQVPSGAVAVLNNVIGNVLPDEQIQALETIKSILA